MERRATRRYRGDVTRPFALDPIALTDALVAMDSRNPSLVPEGPGESACAAFLADVLDGWGFTVSMTDVAPGRPNVVARIGPQGASPLVLNGHLDVVGVDDMTHAPFTPTYRDGALYGRGATDMKAGIAAMCVAAARAAQSGTLASELVVAAVCDEEFASIGTAHLLANGLQASAAIVTEPTRLAIVSAHKGFAWFELVVHGHAAHGSRYDVGRDANRAAARVIAAIDRYERDLLTTRTHPLLGRASIHVPMVQGGTGWSTYAAESTIRLERRTLPGESVEMVREEIASILAAVQREDPAFTITMTKCGAQPPLSIETEHPLVQQLTHAAQGEGLTGDVDGLFCWTDAALFAAAGIPAVCFGPGDIARAHSTTEWVELDQITQATAVLTRICQTWGQ